MKFIQTIEYTTSRIDEVIATLDEWLAATKGKRTAGSGRLLRDRDRANTYVDVVEFPSYEEAMKNSDLPETAEISEKMAKLCDGPPTFRNLDVIHEFNG
jgi:hypothetical protein